MGTLFMLLALAVAVTPAFGQQASEAQVRTLLIRGGQVYIDGESVAPSALPDGLNLQGMDFLQWSWVGTESPVIDVNGQLYRLEQKRLVPHAPAVAFGLEDQARRFAQAPSPQASDGLIVDTQRGELYTLSGERLEGEAATQELVRSTDAFYLQGLRQSNQNLFSRLWSEQRMEIEAQNLAFRIRGLRGSEERTRLIGDLRQKLSDILDFKQENRLAEIRQLEAELDRLKKNLREREKMKNKMIDLRLQELIGSNDR